MIRRSLGVCYYPEHWPEARWQVDAAAMAATGLTWVRIGEFAWSRLEPAPHDLRFGWMDRAIETLGAAGLKVVLGTPTATPPHWMIDRHLDMLPHDIEGRARKFGSRRHYDFSHEGYLHDCRRIVALLAERYGRNPHVAAWQTDNEYGCHDTTLTYSFAALRAFRRWLRVRYGEIEALNAAWGNVFWSMEYERFDAIDLPNLTVTEANPAHWLDFRRFSSDQVVLFNRAQVDEIRKRSDAPILHNFMGKITDFDHYALGADLDGASWDSYPLGFLEDRVPADEAHRAAFSRQGDPDFQAFHHDLYRAAGRGRWWVMEQQPGPVNWAPYNPAPLPGMVRLWTWEALAHGAEAVCYFRWRQAPFGQETMHAGLLAPDAEDAPGRTEAAQVARELGNRPEVDARAPSPVALIFDYESDWAWKTQPQGRDFDYFDLVFEAYRGLRRAGLTIDILPPDTADLSDRALVVIPGLFAWPAPLRAALEAFRGHAVIGPRAGARTSDFRFPAAMPPDLPALETRVDRVETLRPSDRPALSGGGAFQIWREFTSGPSQVIETTEDGVAAVRRAGRLTYLCGWPDAAAMARLMASAARAAGLETLDLPDGLRRVETAAETFWFNYSAGPVPLAAAAGDPSLPETLAGADLHRIVRT